MRSAVLLTLGPMLALQGPRCSGQAAASTPQTTVPAAQQGIVLDQIVGVVNSDLILESDVDEERRFEAFQPFRDQRQFSRERIIARLVDRTLIMQQEQSQSQVPITDAEVENQLSALRKQIPACKQYHCDTDAGWQKFVEDQGFTLEELKARWRERMEVLQFIEMRFKMGIHVTPDEIKTYYDKTLLPEYAKQKATAPKLDTISDRIQEILLQQQVSALLVDWLKSLKAQGSVRMAKTGEVVP
jgi:hypothetical protein